MFWILQWKHWTTWLEPTMEQKNESNILSERLKIQRRFYADCWEGGWMLGWGGAGCRQGAEPGLIYTLPPTHSKNTLHDVQGVLICTVFAGSYSCTLEVLELQHKVSLHWPPPFHHALLSFNLHCTQYPIQSHHQVINVIQEGNSFNKTFANGQDLAGLWLRGLFLQKVRIPGWAAICCKRQTRPVVNCAGVCSPQAKTV